MGDVVIFMDEAKFHVDSHLFFFPFNSDKSKARDYRACGWYSPALGSKDYECVTPREILSAILGVDGISMFCCNSVVTLCFFV